MPSQHSTLPPSAAHRWLMCTPSARLEESFPERDTVYTEEGTYAHALAAASLKFRLGADSSEERAVIRALAKRHNTEEVRAAVKDYTDLVWGSYEGARASTPDAALLVEKRLDLSQWIPEGFGTADAVIVADGTLHVFDLKLGKGVRVSAKDNPQMMIYALGAHADLSDLFRIERVEMTVVQPRLGGADTSDMPADILLDWGESTLKPKADEAFRGNGPQAPGEWCRFCRAAAQCAALRATAVRASAEDPRLLSSDELAAEVLPALPAIRIWLKAVEEHTLAQALAGVRYAGFKLVEGRSVRKIADPEACAAALTAEGYPEVWKERELKTITELERMVGRKRFAEVCGAYVTKPQGRPALVPADDPRDEWDPVSADLGGIDLTEG